MQNISMTQIKVKRVSMNKMVDADDELAVEEPLEVQLLYAGASQPIEKTVSVTMRTPGHDKELAAGFLFTEGIIQNSRQVLQIHELPLHDNRVLVRLDGDEQPVLQKAQRNFYTTSSCGVCGKSSIDAIKTVSVFRHQPDQIRIKASLFYGLPAVLREQQVLFENTGGLHASALFDLEGNFLMLREDVGRHNALDKLIGAAFLNNQLPLNQSILLLSGRASFELVQKAVMAGIKIVASVGAPSSLAVQMAQDNGITIIGFLHPERFNIYSGGERILL